MSHTLSGNEWPWETTSGAKSYNELQRVVQRMATSGFNKWQRVVQRVTPSGTTSDNERQRLTTNDKEWQRFAISVNFPFFWIREELNF